MKNIFFLLLLTPFFFTSCGEEAEVLPDATAVMIKFENKTGKDIEKLAVSRADVGELKKGKSSEYFEYNQLGQQFGYALVEAVGTINGDRYFTASACQGVCGTDSAPHGEWLEMGYYKISIHIAKDEGKYLEFRMMN